MKLLAAAGSSVVLALAAAASFAGTAPRATVNVQEAGITILKGDRLTEANIALAPGIPVRMTVTNHTREFHTFTVPGLSVSELIRPAHGNIPSRTTFTFTPRHSGAFAWRCVICPSGAHGAPHAMGGALYLIVDPSALSGSG